MYESYFAVAAAAAVASDWILLLWTFALNSQSHRIIRLVALKSRLQVRCGFAIREFPRNCDKLISWFQASSHHHEVTLMTVWGPLLERNVLDLSRRLTEANDQSFLGNSATIFLAPYPFSTLRLSVKILSSVDNIWVIVYQHTHVIPYVSAVRVCNKKF